MLLLSGAGGPCMYLGQVKYIHDLRRVCEGSSTWDVESTEGPSRPSRRKSIDHVAQPPGLAAATKNMDICYKYYSGKKIHGARQEVQEVQEQTPIANEILMGKQPGSSLRGGGPEKRIVVSNEFRSICGHLLHESVQRLRAGVMGDSTRCPSMAASTYAVAPRAIFLRDSS